MLARVADKVFLNESAISFIMGEMAKTPIWSIEDHGIRSLYTMTRKSIILHRSGPFVVCLNGTLDLPVD